MKSAFDRMKRYEASYNILLPPRTYIIVRVDGVGFSKFTKPFNKPFDNDFSEAMARTAIGLAEKFSPDFVYTQSDEISFLLTDFGEEAEAIYGGKLQKICSIAAGRATAVFNSELQNLKGQKFEAMFDARVFIIPDYREVANYFIHRQQDASRNSVSMAAHTLCGHKATIGKSRQEKMDMMMEKGVNWNDYAVQHKRGVVIKKETFEIASEHSETGFVTRSRWAADHETPIFTQDREYLHSLIPLIGE